MLHEQDYLPRREMECSAVSCEIPCCRSRGNTNKAENASKVSGADSRTQMSQPGSSCSQVCSAAAGCRRLSDITRNFLLPYRVRRPIYSSQKSQMRGPCTQSLVSLHAIPARILSSPACNPALLSFFFPLARFTASATRLFPRRRPSPEHHPLLPH